MKNIKIEKVGKRDLASRKGLHKLQSLRFAIDSLSSDIENH